jgi:hypothetical protein
MPPLTRTAVPSPQTSRRAPARSAENPDRPAVQPAVRQVRITLPTAAVLRQMLENPAADHYGFALAEATSFPSGTIYPILARLETAGWLASFWEQGTRRSWNGPGGGCTGSPVPVPTPPARR